MSFRLHAPLCVAALSALLFLMRPSRAQNTPPPKPPHSALPVPMVPEGLGVNIHFTDAKAGELKMLAEGGFKWIRMDLNWAATERELGKYDFSAYDRLLRSLDEHKIRAILILDYGNRLYNPGGGSGHPDTDAAGTPAFRRGYANWAVAAAKHFARRGVLLENWNEPNISGFWKPKPNVVDYSALALEACKAIKAATPNQCMIGPASSTIDMAFLEGCFKAGLLDWWDAVSVHPYRQSAPETATEEFRKLRAMIDKYKPVGKTIPIISGEWGYSAGWGGYDEESQGKMLPRQWLTNLMNDVSISIWYDWHDDGLDPKEPEHHFGTVANKYFEGRDPIYNPKPAYRAAQAFTNTLRGFNFNKRLWTGDDNDYVALFSKGDEVRLAAWTTSRDKHTTSIPASDGAFGVVGHLGEAMSPLNAAGNTLKIEVSDAPKYFVPKKPNDLLRTAASWERAPKELFVRGPATIEQRLQLTGPTQPGIVSIAAQSAVTRSAQTRPLEFNLEMGNGLHYLQRTPVFVTNPLEVVVLPFSKKGLQFQINNPSGEAFAGELVVARQLPCGFMATPLERHVPIPIVLNGGEFEKLLDTDISPDIRANRILLRQFLNNIDSKKASIVVNEPFLKPETIDDFARAGVAADYEAVSEGDVKVLSTQSVGAAMAPEKLFGEDVPSLKLDYKWDAGWKFVQVKPKTDALKNSARADATLQMWVYGDGSGNLARMRFVDETGQTFQPNGGKIDFKGWKLLTFKLDGSDSGFWGGANDGRVHGQIRFDTLFLLDSANRTAGQGTIYLAAPTLSFPVYKVR